ncbi:HupE/UreJ family protein [Sphingomonas sp. LY54]|uniref:HupE/UreJ family protein n=1 Tax=Sphingomonas sp. LY54 TaxID=3095343 RepID=UPI002D768FAB|nr:HupE/UreJ family protein [Sphingomonas sp. LY54]WRP27735.1 HupE/UreJ family protein [Sphingomonas sp. LY54]
MPVRLFLAGAALMVLAAPALAHPALDGRTDGFVGGVAHPLLGLDHVAAMIAIGLWAAVLGRKATRQVPVAFVAAMVGGFLLAASGGSLPGVEPGIAASVLILGLLIAAAVRLPLAASMGLAGLFAVFHGHAHGSETSGNALAIGLGLGTSTILLLAAGLWVGTSLAQRRPPFARGLGAAIAGFGLVLVGGLA